MSEAAEASEQPTEARNSLWRWLGAYGITTAVLWITLGPLVRTTASIFWGVARRFDLTTAPHAFDLYSQHLFALYFFPMVIVGFVYVACMGNHTAAKVARWIFILPTVVLAGVIITWHAPLQHSVFGGPSLSAYFDAVFQHFFGTQCRYFTFDDLFTHGWDLSGCLHQVEFVVPFYYSAGFSLGSAVATSTIGKDRASAVRTFAIKVANRWRQASPLAPREPRPLDPEDVN